MITVTLDTIKFHLKEIHDFSWLQAIGNVFAVFDQNDSGNISFGVRARFRKIFIKLPELPLLNLSVQRKRPLRLSNLRCLFTKRLHTHI
mgnify:CR=1 FL=1